MKVFLCLGKYKERKNSRMTNEDMFLRVKELTCKITPDQDISEYYARYARLLAIESEGDNEEEIEFLNLYLKILKDYIVLCYMQEHGYEEKTRGLYSYWEKKDKDHFS